MISNDVITAIKLSTCAIQRMAEKHEVVAPRGIPTVGGVPVLPETDVEATAFLVRPGLLLTNRHVVQQIADEYHATGTYELWYAMFTYPREKGVWTQAIKRITTVFAFLDKSGGGLLDIGLLGFSQAPKELGPCQPVRFGSLDSLVVGADVAMCGFPLGNDLLVNSERGLHRMGPAVHAGMISAISPYDFIDNRRVTSFLTDISTAKGMSGSPVFLPATGEVVGLHYAGNRGGTIGCALPVDASRVQGWMELHDRAMAEKADVMYVGEIRISPGGDVVT